MTYEVREVLNLQEALPDLQALHLACHDELSATHGTPFNYRYDLMGKYWHAGVLRIFGAYHNGKLIGHATGYVSVSVRTGKSIATEDVLYVLPAHRKGVGSMLTKATIKAARELGIHQYLVTVPLENEVAAGIAKRYGFKEIGRVYELITGES